MVNSDNKRKQIVKAAVKRFAHFGIPKTTMNEIAEDVNLTKANLYYYFPDKNSLIKDVLLSIVDEMDVEEQIVIKELGKNLLELLYKLLDVRVIFVKKYYMFYLFENMDWIKDSSISAEIESLIQKDEDQYCQIFERAKAAGEIVDLDPRYIAKNYSDAMRGIGFMGNLSNIVKGFPSIDNIDDIVQRQKEVTEIMLYGLSTKNRNN
ncbi:TetR/AcrR family transcriptional regulator [Sphingobacterium sp. SYP-B4668]|uniref:TetR/AcrR family transcriptional regulator n=1 Tax=Sphingobacterium sp. SYP-B4668 TaxID=2996035 RepID=UPI0022DD3430|nr:TetR/AcrR family transcriptional regulator [Sphingobacterium sp. SYP-B4668]